MSERLQWGGRFDGVPDAALLAFGSSLEDDLVLAPFDVATCRAHVIALRSGNVISEPVAEALEGALAQVALEVQRGTFDAFARASATEDVHGAIDLRVRQIVSDAGEWLHTGRSRNDQVATTLLLYVRDRAERGASQCAGIARSLLESAESELEAGTLVAATTHGQPAQPALLALWLEACAEAFARAWRRFASVAEGACAACPLGSAACCGSSLPLDRDAGAQALGFRTVTRNALDAVGDRDVALDLLHACTRALIAAGRVSAQIVGWCAPAYGYVSLDDAAATGSSLMPQKRNPDPFELVRAAAAASCGQISSALATTAGLPLSYHRDLQETKSLAIRGTERALATLGAFARALASLHWNHVALNAHAADGFAVATDIADALIARGIPPRTSHRLVGRAVAQAEAEERPLKARDLVSLSSAAGIVTHGAPLSAPLDAAASVNAKRTSGSTHPGAVRASIDALRRELDGSPL